MTLHRQASQHCTHLQMRNSVLPCMTDRLLQQATYYACLSSACLLQAQAMSSAAAAVQCHFSAGHSRAVVRLTCAARHCSPRLCQ